MLVEVSEANIITSSTDPELADGETEEESNVKVRLHKLNMYWYSSSTIYE